MAKITLDDIMNLEGNKVPTDAKSYSTFIYANPKTGKSTFVNNVEIIGGAPAMVNGKEYDEEQIALVDKIRKEELATLEDGYVPSTTSEANVGFGTSETTKKESLSDDELDVDGIEFDF